MSPSQVDGAPCDSHGVPLTWALPLLLGALRDVVIFEFASPRTAAPHIADDVFGA